MVSEVPELNRKLRESCSNNFRNVSSISELVVPSYDHQKKCSINACLVLSPLAEGIYIYIYIYISRIQEQCEGHVAQGPKSRGG